LQNIGDQVGAWYASGAWAPKPPRNPPNENPCWRDPGRLGQETTMVPGDPVSVQVCEGTNRGDRVSYRSVSATDGYRGLVVALDALPTGMSSSSCQGAGQQVVSYSLLFQYAEGPPVLVRVDPNCDPSIDNQSLQARDASTVLPLIRQLLGAGS
jgi:hypothetical protein